MLERLQDDTGSIYRVTIVKRCATLGEAKDFFLQEIPEARQDFHEKAIADYAAQSGIKLQPKQKKYVKLPPAPAKRGQRRAKSK